MDKQDVTLNHQLPLCSHLGPEQVPLAAGASPLGVAVNVTSLTPLRL